MSDYLLWTNVNGKSITFSMALNNRNSFKIKLFSHYRFFSFQPLNRPLIFDGMVNETLITFYSLKNITRI